jgi:hypothetical protein
MKKLVLLFAFVGCFGFASNAQSCSGTAKAATKACCAHPTPGCDKNAKGTASTAPANEASAVQVVNSVNVAPAKKACCAGGASKACSKDTKTTSVEVAPTPANGGQKK